MGLELRQQLKLSQQLVMTPQLQQAIRLLQLSRIELAETIQTELLENPFLEEAQDEISAEKQETRTEGDSAEGYEKDVAKSADWEDYLGEFASTPKQLQLREYESGEEISSLESFYASKPTLESHLMWQLRLSSLTEEEKNLGEIIIGNLSSSGYLQASLKEMAHMGHTSQDKLEIVLHAIQRFDPVGVAARTPQECLLIQTEILGYNRDPILVDLIQNHLDNLEARRYKPVLRSLQLSMEDLKEYIDIIQSLDPLPGASYGEGETTYISPDVFVYQVDGEFIILLNDEGLPNLHLNSQYEQAAVEANDKDKEYFNEKLRSASWLIKSLHQRQKTLYKVVESIVKYQTDFFQNGVTKLRPLILKDIAEDIEMHESTVSRITTNKYVATPFGVFELKFFFNSALDVNDGSQVGSESVKAMIKKCISEENPKTPLSDERIGEILKEHLNVNIARRTVAKYRMAMAIPSSSRRKTHF